MSKLNFILDEPKIKKKTQGDTIPITVREHPLSAHISASPEPERAPIPLQFQELFYYLRRIVNDTLMHYSGVESGPRSTPYTFTYTRPPSFPNPEERLSGVVRAVHQFLLIQENSRLFQNSEVELRSLPYNYSKEIRIIITNFDRTQYYDNIVLSDELLNNLY